MTLLVRLSESSGGRMRSLPLYISFHHGYPCSYITWGINNRPIGVRSSETSSRPIKMMIIINMYVSEKHAISIVSPEDGESMFLRNVGIYYKYARRHNPEQTALWSNWYLACNINRTSSVFSRSAHRTNNLYMTKHIDLVKAYDVYSKFLRCGEYLMKNEQ
jgi:hypothetical protein